MVKGLKSLSQLIGKRVRLSLIDGRVLEGDAVSFMDFVEGGGKELIGLDYGDRIEGAYEDEIQAFEIL